MCHFQVICCPVFLRENSNVIEITKESLTIEKSLPSPKVENLQTSIAVSGNIVNDTNVKEASVHLQRNALVDHRAGELLEEWLHRGLIK